MEGRRLEGRGGERRGGEVRGGRERRSGEGRRGEGRRGEGRGGERRGGEGINVQYTTLHFPTLPKAMGRDLSQLYTHTTQCMYTIREPATAHGTRSSGCVGISPHFCRLCLYSFSDIHH